MVNHNKIQKILLKSFIATAIFVIIDFILHSFIPILKITYYPFNWFNIQSSLINYSISKLIFSFIFIAFVLFIYDKIKTFKNLNYYAQFSFIAIIMVIILV